MAGPATAVLDGYSVLLTRPSDTNEPLARMVEAAGGTAIRAPMMIVAPVEDGPATETALAALDDAEIVVFVSRNAVEFGLDLLDRRGASLDGRAVFAVGLGTAGTLAARGVGEVTVPANEFSSEGLLRLDALTAAAVRGRGGRETLAGTLTERGAAVTYCECYERRKPAVVLAEALAAAGVKVPDAGLATSVEALANLVEKIEQEGIDRLFDMQMIVVGRRVAAEVESLGFTRRPLVVDNPSNDSIMARLEAWADGEA
ncbi:MAG: uroporphyrinogen-III synthase [Gammaproteobacteria bacterium]